MGRSGWSLLALSSAVTIPSAFELETVRRRLRQDFNPSVPRLCGTPWPMMDSLSGAVGCSGKTTGWGKGGTMTAKHNAHDDFTSNSIRYCSKYQTAKNLATMYADLVGSLQSRTRQQIYVELTTKTRQLLANVDQTRQCKSWNQERWVAIRRK